MRTLFRKAAACICIAVGTWYASVPGVSFAQEAYPARPVTLIVPYPPGGAVDAFARAFAEGLKQDWKAGVVIDNKPGSEDFAFMLEKVPGSYLMIGNGDAATGGHGACMVHNPNYDFNDDNMATGSAYWVALTERFLTDLG